ncbi:MAG TPA: ABC transporter permease [Thermoanaerobaculia bacterium]|nr:ABC transporter permease [Thermoanaerobaculia bacterium]
MEHLSQDLRFAVRTLAKKPSFTLVAVLSLALGIGANTTIFSLVNALLLRPLPVEEPDRLVAIYNKDVKNPGLGQLSHLNWKDYREQNRVFSGVLGYDWTPMSVATGRGEAELAFGQLVSGNYFDLLGIEPALGRTFLPEEDGAPGAHPVAVVSHRFWEERLGADPGAVGKTIRVNGSSYTVIGVAPATFTGLQVGIRPELWIPMAMNRQIKPDDSINWYDERRGLFVNAVGRLAPGMSLEQVRADLAGIAQRLERDFPDDNRGRGIDLVPLPLATVDPDTRQGVVAASTLLMVVVGLVLLIACANVANLLLARAASRRKEIAIRLSQGAARSRVLRQLMTESLLLALLGGAVGLLLMVWARRALLAFLPSLPFPVAVTLDLGLDPLVLVFTVAVSLLTGLLFGLVPALQTSRPELVSALKNEAAPPAEGRRGFNLRNLLVAGQMALSLLSLIAAGLFLRSLGEAREIDPGFDPSRLAVVSFDAGLQGWDAPRTEQFLRDLTARVAAIPGVESAALAQAGPFQGTFLRSVFLEGGGQEDGTLIPVNLVGTGYFSTMGVPLVRGRLFDERDREGAVPVVVINQTMAERLWPGKDAVGQRFKFFGDAFSVEVAGVVRDIKYGNLGEDPQPYIYQPLEQRSTTGLTLVTRAERDPSAVLPAIQREVRAMAPELPLVNVSTVTKLLDDSLWAPRAGATLLALFGALALALAALGLYGVMSYSVTLRSREIGIRMALGARQLDVLGLVLGQGMKVVAAGGLLGLLLAFFATRLAAGMLVGVSPTDPVAFGTTSALLGLVAMAAILLPARRATELDPIVVLRYE